MTKLSQVTREVRANLMTQLDHPTAGTVTAVLHHSRLALLEALVAAPRKARQADLNWFRNHLLVPYVELRANDPLDVLQEGLGRLRLVDQSKRDYALLYMTVRRLKSGIEYRIYFDGPLVHRDSQDLLRLELRLPGIGIDPPWQLRWAISQGNLKRLDEQYMLYALAPLRELVLARRAAILGHDQAALTRATRIAQCASGRLPHMTLLRPLVGLASSPRPKGKTLGVVRSAEPSMAGLVQEASLRAALLERTVVSVARRLLAGRLHAEATGALLEAIEAIASTNEGMAERAFTAFDRRFAKLLHGGLLSLRPVTTSLKAVGRVVIDGTGPTLQQVDDELRRRVAHALRGLRPQWVAERVLGSGSGPIARPEEYSIVLTASLPGVGGGLQVVAQLGNRLGAGWWHPGLPDVTYTARLADRSGALWAARVAKVPDHAGLQRLARDVLRNEAFGPDARAAELAARELVRREGLGTLPGLAQVAEQPQQYPRGVWIRASSSLSDARVDELIGRSLASQRSGVRAAAMHALGVRGGARTRERLEAGVGDPSLEVSSAALLSLFELRPSMAARRTLAWLDAGAERRNEGLRVIARTRRLSKAAQTILRPVLLRLLRQSPTPDTVRAAARVTDVAATKWTPELFQRHPEIRGALVASITRTNRQSLALLDLALAAQQQPTLRRQAAERLARVSTHRQIERLRGFIGDPDFVVQTAAMSGLARLGDTEALLGLGAAARHGCAARRLALPLLCRSLDPTSLSRLLARSIPAYCPGQGPELWELVTRHMRGDVSLLRLGLGHRSRTVRVEAASALLAQRAQQAQ